MFLTYSCAYTIHPEVKAYKKWSLTKITKVLRLFFLLIVNYLCNVPYQENIIPISPGNEIFDYSFFSICEGFRFLRWILGNNAFVFASSLNALTITNCFEEIWSDTVLSRVNRGLLFRHNQGTVRFSWRRTRLSILGNKAKLYIIRSLSLYCT